MRETRFNPSYEALAGALDRHAGQDVGDMMRSPFAGPLSSLGDNGNAALIADAEKALEPFFDDNGVTFAMETRWITAWRG